MATLSSYQQMTGRTLPTGITSAPATPATPATPAVISTPFDSSLPVVDSNPDLMTSILADINDPNSVINEPMSPEAEAAAAAASSAENIGNIYADFATASQAAPKNNDNAIEALKAMFNAYGLGVDVSQAIVDMVQKGYTADTISLIAQDPTSTNPLALAMQARFPANKQRLAAGLSPLSPSEYMATERSYRQVMQSAGLPVGFYDQHSDFTNFLAKDISPTEIKTRVDLAASSIANADPFYVRTLQQEYGLSTGDMIAHVLDPNAALPLIQKQAAAVQIGTAAARQGMGLNAITAENLYAQGVTQAQAEQGFKNIALNIAPEQALAARWGGDAGAQGQNLVASTFGTAGAAYAEQQLKALSNQELNAFSGSSGAGKGSLAGTEAGQS